MAGRDEILTLSTPPVPEGATPWVAGRGPALDVEVVEPDARWPQVYAELEAGVRAALGSTVVSVEHVGSTAVPGLAAKPVVDVALVVPDPADEAAYVPALVRRGYVLVVREPWDHEHRVLRLAEPRTNLHVHPAESPELTRLRIFRDWLRESPEDRALYAEAKRAAARDAAAAGEHAMQYNARKEPVVHEIYGRAFRAAGLLPPD